jgi:hypothetical protein
MECRTRGRIRVPYPSSHPFTEKARQFSCLFLRPRPLPIPRGGTAARAPRRRLQACDPAGFENLVRSLIMHASSELRKIKQRQEDLVMSSARTDRSRFRVASMPSPAEQTSPRNDIAMLYSFIGILYSALPAERALQFWGSGPQADSHRMTYLEYVETTAGKLPTFLQWAVWSTQVREQDMSTWPCTTCLLAYQRVSIAASLRTISWLEEEGRLYQAVCCHRRLGQHIYRWSDHFVEHDF